MKVLLTLPFLCLPVFFFFQSPPKGATIPYRPKPASTPVIFSGGQVRAEPALQRRLLVCAPNQLGTFTAKSAATCVFKHFHLVPLYHFYKWTPHRWENYSVRFLFIFCSNTKMSCAFIFLTSDHKSTVSTKSTSSATLLHWPGFRHVHAVWYSELCQQESQLQHTTNANDNRCFRWSKSCRMHHKSGRRWETQHVITHNESNLWKLWAYPVNGVQTNRWWLRTTHALKRKHQQGVQK